MGSRLEALVAQKRRVVIYTYIFGFRFFGSAELPPYPPLEGALALSGAEEIPSRIAPYTLDMYGLEALAYMRGGIMGENLSGTFQ